MNKKKMLIASLSILFSWSLFAADYTIDDPTKGAHASINFKIQHLGYSWLSGNFKSFSGSFSYDADNPSSSKVSVEIDTNSIYSNHAKRDIHLRSDDFLSADKYPKATFVSKKVVIGTKGELSIEGDFTLKGVTKPITILANKIGEGNDPWGGYRAGFSGTTRLSLKDFGIQVLGPASAYVELDLHIEGVRKK